MVDLKELSRSALADIVETYPWFAAARAELCRKDLEESGVDAADARFRDILPYLPQGSSLAQRLREGIDRDYSDADLAAAIRGMIKEKKRTALAGGDYFSRDDYDVVRNASDDNISRIAVSEETPSRVAIGRGNDVSLNRGNDVTQGRGHDDALDRKYDDIQIVDQGKAADGDMVTETLAKIYADQGYPEQAMEIYRKLSLANPEKSVYFATLIDRLKSNI